MKKTSFLILLFVLLLLTSCKQKTNFKDAFAIVYQDGIPYLLNADGEKLSLAEYDDVNDEFGEYIIVRKYQKQKLLCGYIDRSGNEIIKPQYEMAYPFSEGVAVVVKDGQYKLINTKNETVYTFDNDVFAYGTFVNGFLKVEVNGKYSFMDKNYQIASISYDTLENFQDGYALCSKIVNGVRKYSFIDTNFNEILTNELAAYNFVDNFYDGWARVKKVVGGVEYYSFINDKGEILTDENGDSLFEDANNFHNGLALIFTGKPYHKIEGSDVVYYSYRYIASDQTYPGFSYRDSRVTNKNQCLSKMIFSDFVGDYMYVKMITSGAGYYELYKNEPEDGKPTFTKIKLQTKNEELTISERDSYSTPYAIEYLKYTPYYENGVDTILLVTRVYSDAYGIVTMDGYYIFDAIFERVIL